MAVYSMTGYSSAQAEGLGLEIRSVNSRYLDLGFRLPDEVRQVEPALRELLGGQLKRGKVELRLSVGGESGTTVSEPSPRLLQRLNGLQDAVLAWLPQAAPLSVAEVLRLGQGEAQSQQRWTDTQILALAEQAVSSLKAARAREGARLETMLRSSLNQLRNLAQQAQPLIPQLVEQQRQKFLERWAQAMAAAGEGGQVPESAHDRALTEATAFAIRIDVAEELTRLASHLDEIERLLKKGGEMGKRLDFLIQELHREANTLGSKSSALELTRISVDMKVLIEQMREQVQNVE